MTNKFFSVILGLVLLTALITTVSAKTIIAGKIYDGPNFETASAVENASVQVTCNNNTLTTATLSDGTYSVAYETQDCPDASQVAVFAEKDGDSNSGEGVVHDYTAVIPEIYLGVVNIPLLPEFGTVVGILTVVSAIGVFFIVRRS